MKTSYAVSSGFGENEGCLSANTNLNKMIAVKVAKKLVKEGEKNVFVSFFKEQDHTHGYLNPCGNHDVEGEKWD